MVTELEALKMLPTKLEVGKVNEQLDYTAWEFAEPAMEVNHTTDPLKSLFAKNLSAKIM